MPGDVPGRVERGRVGVRPAVPGRGDDEHPGRLGPADGRVEQGVVRPAAPACVNDRGPVGDRVVDRPDRAGRVPDARIVDELHAHKPGRPGHPADAGAVVPGRPDDPGDVSAVAVPIERVAVVVRRVGPIDIVDVPVPVVVTAVAGDLARVPPHVRGQVRVAVVDPAVDHRDDGPTGAAGDVPARRRVDRTEPGLTAERRVVRRRRQFDPVVRGHGGNAADFAEHPDGPVNRHAGRQADPVDATANSFHTVCVPRMGELVDCPDLVGRRAAEGDKNSGRVEVDGRDGPVFERVQAESSAVPRRGHADLSVRIGAVDRGATVGAILFQPGEFAGETCQKRSCRPVAKCGLCGMARWANWAKTGDLLQ